MGEMNLLFSLGSLVHSGFSIHWVLTRWAFYEQTQHCEIKQQFLLPFGAHIFPFRFHIKGNASNQLRKNTLVKRRWPGAGCEACWAHVRTGPCRARVGPWATARSPQRASGEWVFCSFQELSASSGDTAPGLLTVIEARSRDSSLGRWHGTHPLTPPQHGVKRPSNQVTLPAPLTCLLRTRWLTIPARTVTESRLICFHLDMK